MGLLCTTRLSGRDFCSQGLAHSLSPPFIVSSQLQCFPPQILPLSPNFFLLVAFEAQYYTKVSFQQNACDYQISRGLPVVYNLLCQRLLTFGQDLTGETPKGGHQGCR